MQQAPGMAVRTVMVTLDATQVATLVRYLRQQFAPGRPAWTGVGQATARVLSAL